MRLLKNQVLLEYNPKTEDVTDSGIILDLQEQEDQIGTVAHVGEGCNMTFIDDEGVERGLRAGDQVYFKRSVANKFKPEDTLYLQIQEQLILAVV